MINGKIKHGAAAIRVATAFSLIALFCSVFASRVAAANEADKLIKIQAGFIYHLAKLVEWPEKRFEKSDAPIIVGFVGEDTKEVADYFESQAPGYAAQGRKLVVRRLFAFNRKSADELRRCHIVFVSLPDRGRLRLLLNFCQSLGVLTVSGTETFADLGGMVGFYVDRGSMKIKVNLGATQKAGLKISAQFLQHATIVK